MRLLHQVVLVCSLVASGTTAVLAQAQQYPSQPIRIIIPFSAGGAVDILGRILGQNMTATWGQAVIVENRTGGAAQIATRAVAQAKPDGYTLLFTANPHTVNPGLFENKLPYDTKTAFAPISLITAGPLLLVVHPSLGVSSVKELIDLAKARNGAQAYASSGTGGPQHMAGELFQYKAKVKMVHIPFKGGGEALPQLIGGHVTVSFSNLISVLDHVRSGRLRALAVTSSKRAQALPDIPTVAEAGGLAGYEVTAWLGMLAPAATPKDIINKLQAEFKRQVFSPAVKDRLVKDGNEPIASTPEEFGELIDREIASYAELIKAAGIKPE